jgi:hypothetical protein
MFIIQLDPFGGLSGGHREPSPQRGHSRKQPIGAVDGPFDGPEIATGRLPVIGCTAEKKNQPEPGKKT